MHHRDTGLRLLGTAVVAGTVLVACGGGDSDPKLGEVAATFEQDANEIFVDIADTYGLDSSSVDVTMDGSEDLNCGGDGRGQRMFEGVFPLRESGDPDDTLDLVDDGISSAFSTRGYELEGDLPSTDGMVRDFAFTDEDGTIMFQVTATGEPALLAMTGETPSLEL